LRVFRVNELAHWRCQMPSGVKGGILACFFLTVLGVIGCRMSQPSPVLIPSPTLSGVQSDCIEQTLGDAKIITSREMDVDWDRDLELVILYVSEDKSYKPIHVMMIKTGSAQCMVVCDKQLTLTTLKDGEQLATSIREIEVIELTGDVRPELHIWMDQLRPGEPVEYHAILTPVNGSWKHALGSTGITRNPARPLFEFRDAPNGESKDIYLESYYPLSDETRYTIMRWDGSKFMPVEGDVINIAAEALWLKAGCIAMLVVLAGIVTLVATRWRRRKRDSSYQHDYSTDLRPHRWIEMLWVVLTFVMVLLIVVCILIAPLAILSLL
jgi:hypothetical protein